MYEKFLRLVKSMELEEKVLHIGVLICLLGIPTPWIGGQWYGNTEQWSGFGFHTGFIGHAVFLMQIFLLAITLSPFLGGPIIVRKPNRSVVRLFISALCTALLVSAFTVLLRLTSEVSGAEIRFGIYLTIVGSTVTTLYAFLRYQEEVRAQAQALFHHPDEPAKMPPKKPDPLPEEALPPPPPPPPPLQPEDHHFAQP